MIGAFALLGLGTQAQNGKVDPVDRAWVELNTQVLNVELGLNDPQQEQLKEINLRYVKRHEAIETAVPKPTENEMANKVATLMAERDRELRKVFNEDQYAKWEKKRQMGTGELREDQKEKMKK